MSPRWSSVYASHGRSISSGPVDWPPFALRRSAAMTRYSPLNSSIALNGALSGEERDLRVQSAAGDEQQRKAGAGLFVIDAGFAFFVERHGSVSWGRSRSGVSSYRRGEQMNATEQIARFIANTLTKTSPAPSWTPPARSSSTASPTSSRDPGNRRPSTSGAMSSAWADAPTARWSARRSAPTRRSRPLPTARRCTSSTTSRRAFPPLTERPRSSRASLRSRK